MSKKQPMDSLPASLFLSGEELATLLGINATSVYRLARDGVIQRNGPNRYDARTVVPAYCESLRGRKGSADAAPGTAGSYKNRQLAAAAKKAEMEVDRMAGKFVAVEEVEKLWMAVGMRFRQRMLGLPTKAAPLVAVETDTAKCQAVLETFVNDALAELAQTDGVPSGTRQDPEEVPESTDSPAETDGERVG